MTGSLTAEQVEQYWQFGYVNRVPALSPEVAAHYLARLEEIERQEIERRGGTWWPRDFRSGQDDHPLAGWLDELVRQPSILDAASSILGPNLLVRNADVFLKEPSTSRGIGWHQDTAERGPDADCLLTAWVGLTASTRENGCLEFSARSHRLELPDGPTDKFSLTLKPRAVAALDPAATVPNLMEPGMMSMHHFRTVHRSAVNRSSQRRVGFVVRFMSPAISQATAESGQATLVRGVNEPKNLGLKDRFPMTWSS
jgi:non-heme Fe2+,alpha-ketoglutarate-dependent halogenase